jgi:thiamine pyrophosphate-dependent acetolactate synthase large subunit-like protein
MPARNDQTRGANAFARPQFIPRRYCSEPQGVLMAGASPVRRRAPGLHPREVVQHLNKFLPQETLIYCDIGNITAWVVRHLRRELPGTFFTDTVSGAMDYAIPAAIGGKLGAPQTPVCALVGDGGALMGSILDVFSAVEQAVPIAVIVFNDGGWGMLEHGIAQSPLRNAKRPSFRFRRRVDFAKLAHALHAEGVRVRTLTELRAGLARCVRLTRPLVLDVLIDPDAVPPIGGRTAHVNRHMEGS